MAASASSIGKGRADGARMAAMLVGGRQIPVMLSEVTGAGALAVTGAHPAAASAIVLRHPLAGSIGAEVVAVERAGVRLRFKPGEASVGFALAIAALGYARALA